MEEWHLLTGSWLVNSSHSLGPPAQGCTSHGGLGPHLSTGCQDSAPQTYLQAILITTVPMWRLPLPRLMDVVIDEEMGLFIDF